MWPKVPQAPAATNHKRSVQLGVCQNHTASGSPKATIVIWQHLVIVCFAAPVAFWFWQTPTWVDLLWFLAAGFCGTAGHICQQRGYQLADITLLQPIGFLSLIWNTLLGYFLFFQSPDVWTFVGAAVIFASAMYISHREAVRRAQIKTADTKAGPEA